MAIITTIKKKTQQHFPESPSQPQSQLEQEQSKQEQSKQEQSGQLEFVLVLIDVLF